MTPAPLTEVLTWRDANDPPASTRDVLMAIDGTVRVGSFETPCFWRQMYEHEGEVWWEPLDSSEEPILWSEWPAGPEDGP